MTNKKERILLVDSNSLIHRAFHALPPLTSPDGKPTGAVYGYVSMLLKVIRSLKPKYIVAVWDTKVPTFRHLEYKEYKAQRPKTDPALLEQIPITQEILDSLGIPQFAIEGVEADDVIGTIAKELDSSHILDVIIVTGDMDLLQLVSDNIRVFTMRRGVSDTVLYDEDKVRERYGGLRPEQLVDYKALRGDPSDNIPGVRGIGDKGAIKLLLEYGSLDEIYNNIDKINGRLKGLLLEGRESAFTSQALATIKTDVRLEFDIKKAEVTEFKVDTAIDTLSKYGMKSLVSDVVKLGRGELNGHVPTTTEEVGGYTIVDSDTNIRQVLKLTQQEWSAFEEDDWLDFDCSIVENVLTGATGKALTTDSLARKYLKIAIASDAKLSDEQLRMIKFAITISLQKALKEKHHKKREQLINEVEFPLRDVLRKMEKVGICVDREYLYSWDKSVGKQISELEKTIYNLVGYEFNINSPKQLSDVLFKTLGLPVVKKTKTHASTDEGSLRRLVGLNPVVENILEYRRLFKLRSTYILPLLDYSLKDGRIHTTFKQAATASGRLSSEHPNLQNIPINDELGFRRVFVSAPEKVLIAADYSQIELRLMAYMSKDEQLTSLFKQGIDVHLATASRIFGKDISAVTPAERKIGKTVNFSIMYGISTFGLAETLNISRQEASGYIENYYRTYPGVRSWQDSIIESVRESGYVESLFGRRRLLPNINSTNSRLKSAAERIAINHPLQGTQADIIKKAMVLLGRQMKEKLLGTDMLLQIHDELIFETDKERVMVVAQLVKDAMENIVKFDPPLIVDVRAGENWLDMNKVVAS